MRCRLQPGAATYNVDRNINYTNVCVYKCRFCAFYRPPGHEEGYLLPFEEIGRKIEETLALNGTGVLLQGGVNPDLPLQYYVDLVTFLRDATRASTVHCFSPPEIKFVAKKERHVPRVIARLKEAGLMSIPGGGAEILSDGSARELAYPQGVARGVDRRHAPGPRHGMRTTATMMFGMGENWPRGSSTSSACATCRTRPGGLHRLHRLDLPARAHGPRRPEILLHEYLKTLAVSRLFLDNVRHLQAWVTQGKKIGQAALGLRRRRHGLDHDRGERRLGGRRALPDEPGRDGST